MSGYPRLAVGSLGGEPEVGPICWALAGCLSRNGRRVRHFHSRACYGAPRGAVTATGAVCQYVDPWLVSTDACRGRLAEAYRTADFVLADGEFAAASEGRGGDLEALSQRLDLPRIVVLDARRATGCRLPARPAAVDGVLLDGIEGCDQFVRMQTCVEGAWGVPVLGGLERDDALRAVVDDLPRGRPVPAEVCEALADRFATYLQFAALMRAADRPKLPLVTTPVAAPAPLSSSPTVAVAYDDAFCGYFADTLDLIERLGARVVDFSPLGDEALPDDADVVLLGCGRPDLFARELAANVCMLSSIAAFARRGGRMYAEGGGLAYLARSLTLDDGSTVRLADALPLSVRFVAAPRSAEPVEVSFLRDSWTAAAGTTLRTYRCLHWTAVPLAPVEPVCDAPDLFALGNVVGGAVQIHVASYPDLLRRWFDRSPTASATYAGVG